jgi:hypothetical protein
LICAVRNKLGDELNFPKSFKIYPIIAEFVLRKCFNGSKLPGKEEEREKGENEYLQ